MPSRTYSSGLLFWVDDNLEGQKPPRDVWSALFGGHSDRVFRLLDLRLEFATSYQEAMETVARFDSYAEAGTFVFCVIDLRIPLRTGMQAAMKYGVALAKELRDRNLTFAFLSSNSGATSILDREGLSTVPYHVKETGNVWRFPNSLVLSVLSELRRRVSWISAEDAVMAMHEDSAIRTSLRLMPESFRYFPYFGPFREFVERCEYRTSIEFGPITAVRSARKHCDEFVQQALAIMLYERLGRKPQAVRVYYGHAHERKYLDMLQRPDIKSDLDAIAVLRVTPGLTSIDELATAIGSLGLRAGKIILVLPNDETVDPYIEYLHGCNIPATEELPQIRFGDTAQQEELIRHCCVLSFHLGMREGISGEPVRLERGSLSHPELLIHPVYWSTLLETIDVPEELSDPFEIVKELSNVLKNLSKSQRASTQAALEQGRPVPYRDLLCVGRHILEASEFRGRMPGWIERTLDSWLKTSWQYPYGITEGLDRGDFRDCSSGGGSGGEAECWQDSCYEILVGILEMYKRYVGDEQARTPLQEALKRVEKFIEVLGGVQFLSADIAGVDWDVLALMRWPHRQYPLPSAILRRLREAGRYLWIQPEGLDVATALPAGRIRYRLLSSIVDQYWSVLTWAQSVTRHLPLGWKWSIGYLTETISEHRIAWAWENTATDLWSAFMTLLRNGGPVMFIADRLAQGAVGGNGKGTAPRDYLASVHGYGKILERLRGSRARRIGDFLAPNLNQPIFDGDIEKLTQVGRYLDLLAETMDDGGREHVHEIEVAVHTLIKAIEGMTSAKGGGRTAKSAPETSTTFRRLFADPEMALTRGTGWYQDRFQKMSQEFYRHGDIPSLFGTKVDYLWQGLDAMLSLENITRAFRYYDSYHFLAALNELRVSYKDNPAPNVPLSVIETLMDLFVASIQGLVAQLAYCVEVAGYGDLAGKIKPLGVSVQAETTESPTEEDLSAMLRVAVSGEDWEVYTLGIPGKSTVAKLCYQDGGIVKEWQG